MESKYSAKSNEIMSGNPWTFQNARTHEIRYLMDTEHVLIEIFLFFEIRMTLRTHKASGLGPGAERGVNERGVSRSLRSRHRLKMTEND